MLSLYSVQISINVAKDSSFYTKGGYSEKYARETQMITIPDTLSYVVTRLATPKGSKWKKNKSDSFSAP